MLQKETLQVSVASNQVDDIVIKQYSSEESNAKMLFVSVVGDNTYEETHFAVCRPSEKAEVSHFASLLIYFMA
ncbi:unnamed protein product [Angiostrongylus costaricensis]|uniref:PsbP domain-containing protein n=1 Tax=Angiostrongylus costaricensis TaxID=334426 RepID=A0A0R3PH24_ANGCS|nr:unnamed protein product [Angiostrongylus costaricensis]